MQSVDLFMNTILEDSYGSRLEGMFVMCFSNGFLPCVDFKTGLRVKISLGDLSWITNVRRRHFGSIVLSFT